jgi:HD-GYP domain-containing protein (c-di-GMP phosphodiesterase class II)
VTDAPYRPENEGPLASPEDMAAETSSEPLAFIAVRHRSRLPRSSTVRGNWFAPWRSAHQCSPHPTTHPLVAGSLDELIAAIKTLADSGFPSVTLNIYKNTLFVENQVFPEESVTYRKLIDEILARGISAITFVHGANAEEAAALVELLGDVRVSDIESARSFLEARKVVDITVAETTTLDETGNEERNREVRARARENYDTGVTAMRDIEAQAKLGRGWKSDHCSVVESMLDNLLQDTAAVIGLTAIKGHDDYTLNHSINVCILSLSLGSAVGLSADELHSLGLAALLYDIGKVRIPEEILAKPGPLTSEEWQAVKRHAEEGADLLKRIQLGDKMPMIVAYEHHQRHDLMGYPEAVTPTEQHLFSKIVSVCDAYDAMTTMRPFRREIRPDKALAVLMQGRAKAYDPGVTKALVAMLGIYPMGAVVKLDDDATAVVYRVNSDDLLHPRVKMLADASGRWLETPEILDLRVIDMQTGEPVRTIRTPAAAWTTSRAPERRQPSARVSPDVRRLLAQHRAAAAARRSSARPARRARQVRPAGSRRT